MPLNFTSQPEFTGAVTDLITAAVSAVATVCILPCFNKNCSDKKASLYWRRLFFMLTTANLFGFVAHAFIWSDTQKLIIWTFLYPILIYTAFCFFVTAYYFKHSTGISALINILCLSAVFVFTVLAIIIEYNGNNGIYCAVIPGAIFIISGFVFIIFAAINNKAGAKTALFAFIPQIIGGIFQFLRRGGFKFIWYFDYNSIYHLCLLLTVIILFISAKKNCSR